MNKYSVIAYGKIVEADVSITEALKARKRIMSMLTFDVGDPVSIVKKLSDKELKTAIKND